MNKQTESGFYWNFWPRNLVEPRMFKNVHWTPFFKWFHFGGSSSPVTDSHWGLVEEDGDGLDLPLVDPVQRVEVEVEELAEPALLELLQLRKQNEKTRLKGFSLQPRELSDFTTSDIALQVTLHCTWHCTASDTALQVTLHCKWHCTASYTALQVSLHCNWHCTASDTALQMTPHCKWQCTASDTAL